ncbi:MAG: hypothetical protein DRP99_01300 [Candidatus Latescibacterota bacterium]|nr:MAG: hypothetical protein DRP99_01300 [Candidatus Latescibacterota bacterium]
MRERHDESVPILKRFFLRILQRSFTELFIWDRAIWDYVAELLARFARTERLYRIKDMAGRRLTTVVEMLVEVSGPGRPELGGHPLAREREIYRHIGDYTLFMSGIFREFVQRRGMLGFYLSQGSRAYLSVWRMDKALYIPGAGLFQALSEDFERISGALDYTKKVYFRPEAHSGPYREALSRLV